MEPFVCVNLIAGLGNQIFQYAAGKRIAKIHGCKLFLNKEIQNIHNVNGHNYIKELFTDASEVDWPQGPLLYKFYLAQGIYSFGQMDGFVPWNPNAYQVPCILSGYYQYYPAIEEIVPEVLETLRNSGPKYPAEEQTTFLHVRRGDYVGKADFHYLQGPEYYLKAIETINPTKIKVFSDDIEWCRQQPWLTNLSNVEFVDEKDEIKSLFQMAACKEGCILANSTFSYWAAMLSGSAKVTYPSRWINQKIHSLFPPSWTCIT